MVEKEFSMDEVDNLLKKLKTKRNKKSNINTTSNIKNENKNKVQKPEIIKPKIENEDNIFGSSDTNDINNIFESNKNDDYNENINNDLFNQNKNESKINYEKTVINNASNNFENLAHKDNHNKNEFKNHDSQYNNNIENNSNFYNNENEKEIRYDSEIMNNKYNQDINNIGIHNIENKNVNNFKTGLVLNNPLERNNDEQENEKGRYNYFNIKEETNNINDNENIEYNSNLENNQKEENNYISNNNVYHHNYANEDNNNYNIEETNNLNNNYKEEINNYYNDNETNEISYHVNNNIYNENHNINTNNYEMEKLDEDQNIRVINNNENKSSQSNIKYNFNSLKTGTNIINQNSDLTKNKYNYRASSDDKINPSYDFTSLDNDYIILASNEKKSISLKNIYSALNSSSENDLYENYFPVSYSKEPDLNKMNNILNIILSNRDEMKETLGHIVVYIFKYILENQLNFKKINLLQNNELKNKILQILSDKLNQENKGFVSISNLFNVEVLYNNNKNPKLNYNMTNEALVHPLEYIINLFNEKILSKNNILYLYFLILNMKENDDFYNHISFEEYDYIFDNFESTLFILLKYFWEDKAKIKNICNTLLNSFSSKIKFCHFVILKSILGDFDIRNGKFYGNIFANYLQFPNIEKIIIADIFSFILFTASSKFKKVIAKSSILIKYKFSLVKQNYKPEKNLLILNQKIYENIHQFGSISKNNYFSSHLKELSAKNLNLSLNPNINNNYNKEQKYQHPPSETVNQSQPQGGIFSKFINVFGFNSGEYNEGGNNIENKEEKKQITETEKKMMTPEELWKLENPGKPEVQYDPVLKRYLIRGKIEDDQEEAEKKKAFERPMKPPPKINKTINKQNNKINNEENNDDTFSDNNKNNRIHNPFGYNQNQKANNQNKKQNKNDLNQRYAVRYNK